MKILTDRDTAEDERLPQTGVPVDIERMLSSRFIHSNDYGTRACSIVKFNQRGQIIFVEHNYEYAGRTDGSISEEIQIFN